MPDRGRSHHEVKVYFKTSGPQGQLYREIIKGARYEGQSAFVRTLLREALDARKKGKSGLDIEQYLVLALPLALDVVAPLALLVAASLLRSYATSFRESH